MRLLIFFTIFTTALSQSQCNNTFYEVVLDNFVSEFQDIFKTLLN